MKSLNSRIVAITVSTLLALGATQALADARDGVLNIGLTAEPFTLDPARGVSGSDYPYLYTLYARLLDFEPKTLKIRPGLAKRWEFSADKKTFTLELRDNLKFHDGTVLDAEAVKASLLHFKAAGRSQDLDLVTSVEAPDATHVVIRLSKPFSPLTAILADRAGMVISPTAQKAAGAGFDLKPVGAGPFKLKTWTPGSRIEVERFTDYWDKDRIKLNGITYRIIQNQPSLVSAMLTGQVDYAFGLDPKNMAVLKARPGIRTAIEPSLGFTMIGTNVDDVLLRRAISMSVDRVALRDAVIGKNAGDGATSVPVPPTAAFLKSADFAAAVKYDPATARQLLAQAGQPNGVTFRICTSNTLAAGTEVTDIEREQMKAAGITLNVTVMTHSACLQAYALRKEYPLWQGQFTGRPHPYMTYQQFGGSTGHYNLSKKVYPGIDEVLDQIAATDDPAVQTALFARLDKLWSEQMPMVPLFFLPNFSAYSDKVAGELPNAQGKPDPSSMYFIKK